MLYAGLDIGGTSVKLGVLDDQGNCLMQTSVPTLDAEPAGLADRLAEALKGYRGKLKAAGISCAGTVNLETRRVTASNLRWRELAFADMLAERIGCPVEMDNDVAGALMGEWKNGACAGERNVVYVSLGTGIGGGFLVNGAPFRGSDNTGGEVGHMVTHADGDPCPCGGQGCWERYASAPALRRLAGGIETEEVFRRAEAGDAEMNAVLDQYVHELVIGLANLCAMMAPELIVIGGGLSRAGEPLLRRVEDQMRNRRTSMPGAKVPKIVLSTLGNQAGMIGGAMLAKEKHA